MIAGPIIIIVLFSMFIVEAKREAKTTEWKHFLEHEWIKQTLRNAGNAAIKARKEFAKMAAAIRHCTDTFEIYNEINAPLWIRWGDEEKT